MVLYIGDKPVGLMKVVEKKVPKVKFGVSIDNLLGNVDAEGNYTAPTEDFVLDLTGVKVIGERALCDFGASADSSGKATRLVGIDANDVATVENSGCMNLSANNTSLEYVWFDSLVELDSDVSYEGVNAFLGAFTYAKSASFKSLKRLIGHGYGAHFSGSFRKTFFDFDSAFPALEYIEGRSVFANFMQTSSSDRRKFYMSKVHTIIQSGGTFSSAKIFNGVYADIYLPSCTRAEAYLCQSTQKNTLHFAAAHQAEIEACEGYDYLFGASEIYFDLMLNITVNGVVYSREYTIGGYTSWKDTDGNIVYTDATAEPAVGTVVYSDQGTTQIGTVSEVA